MVSLTTLNPGKRKATNMKRTKQKRFAIIVNGVELMFDIPATKKAAQDYIRRYLVSTHMGQWVRIPGGYEYHTTIGKYYSFVKKD